jgi:hypothetical protein
MNFAYWWMCDCDIAWLFAEVYIVAATKMKILGVNLLCESGHKNICLMIYNSYKYLHTCILYLSVADSFV